MDRGGIVLEDNLKSFPFVSIERKYENMTSVCEHSYVRYEESIYFNDFNEGIVQEILS